MSLLRVSGRGGRGTCSEPGEPFRCGFECLATAREMKAQPLPARARVRIETGARHGRHTGSRDQVTGEFDVVVACYHDQGLIPVKLLAFGHAVNVTLGLPIVRTSVDHGTAFDIAGKGVANPESMVGAVLLAARLAGSAEQR